MTAGVEFGNRATRPIRFYHQGRIVEVHDEPPTRTLLDWLRSTARRRGTKEGCAEGDCGACTVLLAELAGGAAKHGRDSFGGLVIRPVNACIRFLPSLDGCALLTVEDLRDMAVAAYGDEERLHPVQQAMVDSHASQCGFCTPGFVMSLAAAYERHMEAGTTPTRGQLADDLAGNLCRCTGYRPIIDAGMRMFGLPPLRVDVVRIAEALRSLRSPDIFRYAAGGVDWWAPRTVEELAALRLAKPQAQIIAGATDVGLWVNKQFKNLGDIICVGRVEQMAEIEQKGGFLHIGAAVALEDAWSAVVRHWPELRDVWIRFASPPIRFAGTLGGNVANGSPIGDGPPALIALAARVVLQKGKRMRELPLEHFYLDYMKNALEEGEFVLQLRIPLRKSSHSVRVYKVSKRFDSDISAVLAAFRATIDEDGVITDARFAFGGLAAIAKRSASAEAAAVGRRWDAATSAAIKKAVALDFTPLSDQRGSAAYRRAVVQGLIERFWLETRTAPYTPLAPVQTSVFDVLRDEGAALG